MQLELFQILSNHSNVKNAMSIVFFLKGSIIFLDIGTGVGIERCELTWLSPTSSLNLENS